jgi:DNA gyrase subunit A
MSETILSVPIEKQLANDYLEYSMAVILGRAIPDFRDGLKPISRRILTCTKWLNLHPTAKFLKSARLEGEVMGKLSPHSGSYGAMITMAQEWTTQAKMLDGWGNWGSPTDEAAASRYTEVRASQFSWDALLSESEVWKTKKSYDGSFDEPEFLNVRFPNVLAQITQGVAVGYSTSTICHNLREISDAARGQIVELFPDCPSGCDIVKDEGLRRYITEGQGPIRMRARVEVVKHGRRAKAFVFTNLPINVNTERVSLEIKEAVRDGKLSHIRDVIDGTDKTGIRLTVICGPKADVEEIYRHTSLDTKYNARLLVIHENTPRTFSPTELLSEWLKWRDKRFLDFCFYNHKLLEERIHIVSGFLDALEIIDEIIQIIRESDSPPEAKEKLREFFSEEQANGILALTLSRLTRLERNKLEEELSELKKQLESYELFILDEEIRKCEILRQIDEIANRFGRERQSQLIE